MNEAAILTARRGLKETGATEIADALEKIVAVCSPPGARIHFVALSHLSQTVAWISLEIACLLVVWGAWEGRQVAVLQQKVLVRQQCSTIDGENPPTAEPPPPSPTAV